MPDNKPTCVVCARTNEEVPLLALDYKDQKFWICPQDFPTLIHQPQLLVGKLPGVEKLSPHEH